MTVSQGTRNVDCLMRERDRKNVKRKIYANRIKSSMLDFHLHYIGFLMRNAD